VASCPSRRPARSGRGTARRVGAHPQIVFRRRASGSASRESWKVATALRGRPAPARHAAAPAPLFRLKPEATLLEGAAKRIRHAEDRAKLCPCRSRARHSAGSSRSSSSKARSHLKHSRNGTATPAPRDYPNG
jgi:hypothetical protein